MSLESGITAFILVVFVIAVFYILSIWVYKRAPANMGFVRTGFLGTKVCLGRGAMVLPVFHEVTWVSLETIKIIVSRSGGQAVLAADKIRIDVVAELYCHVGRSVDELLVAARSLGEKTFSPQEVSNLLEAKVVSALRSYAATKTLNELHEDRDAFAQVVKSNVTESFQANGLTLEECTVVTLEQTGKEHFNTDNVFDAEGLKIVTEVTSSARREVHNTEKRTSVAIRQRELDAQLEMLEIEQKEAFARAQQDKQVANEQALQVGEKQVYVLDRRLDVEQKEIDNEKALERLRTERDLAVLVEAERREIQEIHKARKLEEERRNREIALIEKAKEEELANIRRNLALEEAERDRQIALIEKAREQELVEIRRQLARESADRDREIELITKERERREAEILSNTAVAERDEVARNARHAATESANLEIRARALATRLKILEHDRAETVAQAEQEKAISDEQARLLSEKQRVILERRWEVEREEIDKELALETARVQRDIALTQEQRGREAAEIERALAREMEERDRDIALAGKAKELEQAEIARFTIVAERERAEHSAESVRVLADADRTRSVDEIRAGGDARIRRIGEEAKAQITRMHMQTQAEARRDAALEEAEATLTRARATSESQQIIAVGVEREAGAEGRAQQEIETLRVDNAQRMLEAQARGIESKAEALAKFDDVATFLELARLHIEAERDIHVDQAKAMGNALNNAQIRMYGGEGGTVDTIRGLFTSGFGLGEVLEGIAQSMPEGLRQRFQENGIRGIFGRPWTSRQAVAAYEQIAQLVDMHLTNDAARQAPFGQALATLESHAGDDRSLAEAISMLRTVNEQGDLNDVPFEQVWSLLKAMIRRLG